jgi:hypothetical protein
MNMNRCLSKLCTTFCVMPYAAPLVCMGNQDALVQCWRALTSARSDLRQAEIEEAILTDRCLATKPSFEQLRRLSLCLDAFEITRTHEGRVAQLEQQARLEQALIDQAREEERRQKRLEREVGLNAFAQQCADMRQARVHAEQAKKPSEQKLS